MHSNEFHGSFFVSTNYSPRLTSCAFFAFLLLLFSFQLHFSVHLSCLLFALSSFSWSFEQFKCSLSLCSNFKFQFKSVIVFAQCNSIVISVSNRFFSVLLYSIGQVENWLYSIKVQKLWPDHFWLEKSWANVYVFFHSFWFLFQDSGITVKSYPLTVDTSRAIKMKPETVNPDQDNANNEFATNLEQNNYLERFEYAENYRRRLITVTDADYRYKSLILGMCAALIAFLFMLTVFCASRRNDDKSVDIQPINAQQNTVLLNEVITVHS